MDDLYKHRSIRKLNGYTLKGEIPTKKQEKTQHVFLNNFDFEHC